MHVHVMSAVVLVFAAVMVAALCMDVAIAHDSWKRGWIGLALLGSLAAVCAVIGLAFSLALLIYGRTS